MRYYKIVKDGEVVGYQTHTEKLDYNYLQELSEEEYESAVSALKKQAESEELTPDEISAEEFLQLIEEAL